MSVVSQHAQQSAQPPGNAHQILLDVVVTDKSGKPISGLEQQDFTVLDNKQTTPILSFTEHDSSQTPAGQVDPSTEVILILDEINADYNHMILARDGIVKFLNQNGGNLTHPVSLGFLSDNGLQIQTQPSVDGQAMAQVLDSQMQGWRQITKGTGFHGDEELLKRSVDAVDTLITREKHAPGRKVVIWVSPGWPLLSGTRSDLSESQQNHVLETAERLSQGLRDARMIFYSVDPLGPASNGAHSTYYQNFINPLRKAGDAQMGDLGLQVLVTQTGGQAIFGADTIAGYLDRCVADLNATYTITVPMQHGDRRNDFHSIEVRVAQPNLKVRTRNGYYTLPVQ